MTVMVGLKTLAPAIETLGSSTKDFIRIAISDDVPPRLCGFHSQKATFPGSLFHMQRIFLMRERERGEKRERER